MPLYTYVCGPCDRSFDMLKKLSESEEKVFCGACKNEMHKSLGALSFQVKGKGAYSNKLKV